jgi:exosome complex exonuclease DIS3/RRP44
LSYVEAQEMLNDSGLVDTLSINLRNLNSLTKIMRQMRIDRGGLITLICGSHDPFDKGWEAKQMVEELMLAANVSVAEKILNISLCVRY